MKVKSIIETGYSFTWIYVFLIVNITLMKYLSYSNIFILHHRNVLQIVFLDEITIQRI